MNCQEFQIYFNERDDHASTEDTRAQAHAQSCLACKEFAREQNLTNCLRQFAATTAACQSSPAVEAALRQAFRQHTTSHNAPQVAAVASTMPAFEDVQSEANSAQASYKQVGINHLIAAQMANVWQMHRSVFASIIVAAVCLATFGVFAARWQTPEGARNETAFVNPTSRQQNASPSFAAQSVSSPAIISSPSPLEPAEVTPTSDAAYIQNARYSTGRRIAASRPRLKTNGGTMPDTKLATPENQIENEQVATQFFPLDDGLLPPVESGHLMKIEMPRSALASFGLPTSIERSNEVVKAEVLVGTDGIARAIRFVR
ncbi:MAG: hypothetical protein MSG64_02220 [Pyrinomonadaceae bacterium MAG19_C2-C3]|nr:hypothetical protein [Pyrinomonadaceae bacterium MAG19_C2-C3]